MKKFVPMPVPTPTTNSWDGYVFNHLIDKDIWDKLTVIEKVLFDTACDRYETTIYGDKPVSDIKFFMDLYSELPQELKDIVRIALCEISESNPPQGFPKFVEIFRDFSI